MHSVSHTYAPFSILDVMKLQETRISPVTLHNFHLPTRTYLIYGAAEVRGVELPDSLEL